MRRRWLKDNLAVCHATEPALPVVYARGIRVAHFQLGSREPRQVCIVAVIEGQDSCRQALATLKHRHRFRLPASAPAAELSEELCSELTAWSVAAEDNLSLSGRLPATYEEKDGWHHERAHALYAQRKSEGLRAFAQSHSTAGLARRCI